MYDDDDDDDDDKDVITHRRNVGGSGSATKSARVRVCVVKRLKRKRFRHAGSVLCQDSSPRLDLTGSAPICSGENNKRYFHGRIMMGEVLWLPSLQRRTLA